MLTLIMFQSILGNSQEYFEVDPHWAVEAFCVNNGPCRNRTTYTYFLEGDSLIDGLLWHRVQKQGRVELWWDGPPPADPDCVGYEFGPAPYQGILLRQEGRTIRLRAGATPRTLYDFDLEVGDTIPTGWVNFEHNLTVQTVDSIFIGSTLRARYWLNDFLYLIEGVGSSRGLFETLTSWDECGYGLNCFSFDGIDYQPIVADICDISTATEQPRSSLLTIGPNPATEWVQVQNDVPLGPFEILDSSGRPVLDVKVNGVNTIRVDISQLPNGSYTVLFSDHTIRRLVVLH